MLELTRLELHVVLSTLSMRIAEEDEDSNTTQILRAALVKMAREYGYEDGYIEAHIVRQKIRLGRIQQ